MDVVTSVRALIIQSHEKKFLLGFIYLTLAVQLK